jgi:mono/diheme cytochrome c family protein
MKKKTGVGSVLSGCVALGVLTACGPMDPSGPSISPPTSTASGRPALFQGVVKRTTAKVAPISGGTLLVTKGGRAVASDPDRDLVHVVDLKTHKVESIALQSGDEPGRVIEGPEGTAFVVARRGGVVLAIDVARGTARRFPVCAAPRGVAYDAKLAKLYVACRSGVLAVVDAETGAVAARYRVDTDLRDVLLSGDNLVVTRFKTAETLVVSRDGQILRRAAPRIPQNVTTTATLGSASALTPSVAFRALSLPSGGVLVGHVDSSNTTLPSGAGAYYGASCGGSVADLSVSVVDPNTGSDHASITTVASTRLGGATGPLDVALSLDGSRVALLATGNSWVPSTLIAATARPNLWVTSSAAVASNTFSPPCGFSDGSSTVMVQGEPVAVAFDGDGHWVAQSREPAQLQLEQGGTIPLAGDSRFDTGFAMFHMNTGGGIACTSCHPEAGEDGHTWNFSVGPRRSQELAGGVSKRAPFHWTGDLPTFDALVDEVMLKRMSLFADVSEDQRAALRDWLDSVPSTPSADDLDHDAVERGRALFADKELGCATCHGGSDFTDNALHDVGTGGAFVTPSLVDVGVRAPLFHDGCASTLQARFGLCGGGDAHGHTSGLTKAQEADLVAFMQSL